MKITEDKHGLINEHELEDLWAGFTWVGKITLFPVCLITVFFILCIEVIFDAMDAASLALASFGRLVSGIFFKK